MLIIQQNYGKWYEYTISTLETAISLGASMVCIQEPFIENRNISHSGFNLYWPISGENRKDIWVLTAVWKEIANNVVLDNWSNLANHPYCLIFDIEELYLRTRKSIGKTRVINMYDNYIEQGYIWQGYSIEIRRAIQDICWSYILRGRVLLLGDMNAYSTS